MSMNFQGPAKFWLNKVAPAAATTAAVSSSPSARSEVAHQVIRRVTAPTTATASDHREAHWIRTETLIFPRIGFFPFLWCEFIQPYIRLK